MKRLALILAFVCAPAAYAQDDCIENIVGKTVCGLDADAVRARIRAEQKLSPQNAPSRRAVRPIGVSAQSDSLDQPRASIAYGARGGSVYSGFSRQAFVRGGTVFTGGGAEFGKNIIGSAGARFGVGNKGVGIETELVVLRDKESFSDPLIGTFTTSGLGLVGLVSMRYDLDTEIGVNPFASVGVGPGYFRAKFDDGVSAVTADDFTFAYSGRAGVTIDITERFAFETAYRYLDTSQSGFPAQHSVELGLNLGF